MVITTIIHSTREEKLESPLDDTRNTRSVEYAMITKVMTKTMTKTMTKMMTKTITKKITKTITMINIVLNVDRPPPRFPVRRCRRARPPPDLAPAR